ncbi:ribonuclease [Undibacterium sp. LX40W]|uniref:Ribonuclease n=1 Tax=Undibacterium nitidum TaxID=2762298 RepID=A0A923HPB4_9BURK|nr:MULTISPECIES: ribonuclease domain-containing protein [Undibacterium]MBC3883069.1 ribonuclease [Undibacterium nitidum]MBC3893350.1 ribonuclease [Undibacterium sp. LX40W]
MIFARLSLFFKFTLFAWLVGLGNFSAAADLGVISYGQLPREAKITIELIKQGGPFPYEKDGSVFGNYEKQLPKRQRGYYREYTVKTPYARNRGAKRIVTGGQSPSYRYYYTDDHYRSFREVIN